MVEENGREDLGPDGIHDCPNKLSELSTDSTERGTRVESGSTLVPTVSLFKFRKPRGKQAAATILRYHIHHH